MTTRNVLFLTLLAAITAQGDILYTVTNLGTLSMPGNTFGYSINSAGQVTGLAHYFTGQTTGSAFLYSNGVLTDLGHLPGTNYTVGYGINNLGQIAGYSTWVSTRQPPDPSPTGTYNRAFLFSNGVMTDIGTLGGDYCFGFGINDSGQITGHSYLSGRSGPSHAFFYSNGMMTDIGTLGGGDSSGFGINASGQITGVSGITPGDVSARHAFVYSNRVMTDIGTLGGDVSSGAAINQSGQVTGSSTLVPNDNSNDAHAFLYSNGVMTDLGMLPGYLSSSGAGINSYGEVVGTPALLYSNGSMIDLNTVIDPALGITFRPPLLTTGGQIVAIGTSPIIINRGRYLLTPIPNKPPAIGNVMASSKSLWPPNFKIVDVAVSYVVASAIPAACSLSVSSNEPGPGEWQVIDARDVRLLAARDANGTGRVYTVTVTCVNDAGRATADTLVTVPHDQGL